MSILKKKLHDENNNTDLPSHVFINYCKLALFRLLEKLLDANSGILRSDANVVFNYVANNPVGNEIALDFLINRWNDIQNAYDLKLL